jgi:hypothetical protein
MEAWFQGGIDVSHSASVSVNLLNSQANFLFN